MPYLPRIYTASKVYHAEFWRHARERYTDRLIFTARWIDHADVGDHSSGAWNRSQIIQHWIQDVQDVQNSDYLLAYAADEYDNLQCRGTLVEVGVAIASCKVVLAVGFNEKHSWTAHPLVLKFPSIAQALDFVITGHGDI